MKKPGRRFPLLPRPRQSSKFDYGHALVLAGSRSMAGAAHLAATACLRSGAGLVTLATPQGLRPVFQKTLPPEVLLLSLPESAQGTLSAKGWRSLKGYVERRRVNVVALGPGLTTQRETGRLVRKIVAEWAGPIVLDADGLSAFQGHTDLLGRHVGGLVLTPHTGEFECLFKASVSHVLADRVRLAKKTAGRYHGVLVLKGSRTVVATRRELYVNATGNPGLAKGGSGDVLTGILAAFLAQHLSLFEAAAWAVYCHGRAADIAVRRTGVLGLTASDVIKDLPKAFGG